MTTSAAPVLPEFPQLPSFGAHWMPVYWEPIDGSGERITLVVAARTPEGELHVQSAADEAAWACFLGDKARHVHALAELVADSLQAHVESGGRLHQWRAPLSGLQAGESRWALDNDMLGLVRAGLADCAFLARLPDALTAVNERSGESATEPDNLVRLVRSETSRKHPEWESRFQRELPLHGKAKPVRIDYVGERYVANFARLLPGRSLGAQLNTVKIKLFNLERLRTASAAPLLFDAEAPTLELITLTPDPASDLYSASQLEEAFDTYADLEQFADGHRMKLHRCSTVKQVAARISAKEAA